jgi:hypothetical protein
MKKTVMFVMCGLMLASFVESPIAQAHDSARIDGLEQRIKALEELLGSAGDDVNSIITATSKGNWTKASAWKKLKTGMSFDQVERILGKPTKNDLDSSGNTGKWYYEGAVNGVTVSGYLFFSDRRLMSVWEPVF